MGISNRAAYMSTLVKDKLSGGRTPLTVVLNITSRCTLKCGYCYGQYFQSKEKDFTTKELMGLIDELGKMGTRSITLGGGEPLTRNDIGQIIARIKANGIECGFNTNGTLIPLKIKELKQADMICVSIDGSEKINDANRGKGSFKRIVTGIDVALEAGIKTHINSVITRHSCKIEAIDWIVEFAKQKGIQAEFNFLFQQAEGKKDSDRFMAENKELRKAARRIIEHKKKGAPILFSQKVYQLVADWPDHKRRIYLREKPKFKYIPCAAGRFMMFIDADGRVYPCVQLIDIFPALDFRKVGLKKAWENCANFPCYACYFPCFNEFSSIANFDLEIISAQILSTIRGH
ncbi:MAG: hypothetical protein UU73_C0001G0175 [Candidatus Daviesbacteria bacterium GW2011_GWA1_41_61]|uniref:Radical SAM core domain-containing protein n=1 Tax=Candidatus Daviesbacteria bacterium GW2011_GWA2_40_9 TaxID=1618424 RepID=A0A0G0U583_9BACT|nr:MAG: Heme biosynthesis protein [Candidatus Daviesbacteria bacterium GW2011_GWC1_40_9]KKR82341.1 MAG: hypothetical protein UU29_C0015G0007 [Candidatus Daviesbacteria bacterium GW2011_GWA2_40_9]KKR92994.1 MAG: hypothetical protein UU44_C0004G0176 [Candidatus Daviesbacteria bacterium GW2011_GWB1_41_15]KKS15538.1 MAG: hypothetical protein UU73_C0001G0175 [Candidatus Daviesbacteria bacterium GW2011_GWA1_41_61]